MLTVTTTHVSTSFQDEPYTILEWTPFGDLRHNMMLTDSADVNDVLNCLSIAADARFNAYQRQHDPTCLPDTRADLLPEIRNWADGRDERCIFWLSGLAGTGKSTVACTIAREYFGQKRLGASFFFSRGGRDVGHAGKFVTSIVW